MPLQQAAIHAPRPALFSINDDNQPDGLALPPVEGYSTGEVCNSWAVPYFTQAQAMRLLGLLNVQRRDLLAPGSYAYYRPETDAFVVPWAYNAAEGYPPDEIAACASMPGQDAPSPVYPFGIICAMAWIAVPTPPTSKE